ncbi:hypothetical protein [Amycolatopsis sp. GM8]|uniref:hypothetical protein n=1 Tax=Amycolatopsis sp. GM8 TaxID=2896530 RepID=UPI001F184B97|nr:hypothetical protein [Amycolatopsis sp. GM8]
MTASPYDALDGLRAMAATGELAQLCARHGLDLLVVHGSAVDPEPLRPARDLDLAFRARPGAQSDVVALTNDLLDATRFDGVDLMDLGRAGPVARARPCRPAAWSCTKPRQGFSRTRRSRRSPLRWKRGGFADWISS